MVHVVVIYTVLYVNAAIVRGVMIELHSKSMLAPVQSKYHHMFGSLTMKNRYKSHLRTRSIF